MGGGLLGDGRIRLGVGICYWGWLGVVGAEHPITKGCVVKNTLLY